MITSYEEQYMDILMNIYLNGYSDGVNERTGVSTKRLPAQVIRVDVEKEFPILKSKKVYAKTADREMDWIMMKNSNNIHDLNAKIWDEWADSDGSINKAYGYQAGQPVDIYLDPIHKTPESFRHYDSQVHFVLEYLKENPNGRWAKINLWNVQDLSAMNLVPCCHGTDWNLDGGRLNCVLTQRSGDMPYGVPFNTTQYAMLMCKFAKHLEVKPGILTHVIADAHIYDRQMKGVAEQIRYYKILKDLDTTINLQNSQDVRSTQFDISLRYEINTATTEFNWNEEEKINAYQIFKYALNCNPWFYIPEELTNYWEMEADKCKVSDYKPVREIKFGDIVV